MVISISVSLIFLSEDYLPETIRAQRQVNYETGHQRRNPARSQSDYEVQRHGPASVAISRDTAEHPKDELDESFADLLESGEIEKSGPLRQENYDPELLSKRRISFRNN